MVEASKAVFLSYAKQDAHAAGRICEALRAFGIEVWFDQSELRGGDAWDAAIRRQIKSCALFVPIISLNTRARAEGYFRLEWKLAIDRSHLMSSDRPFLVPVAVDDTPETDERVPDRFREVQWTRLPGGETPAAFVERVRRLLDAAEGPFETGPPIALTPPTTATATEPGPAGNRLETSRGRARKWLWPVTAMVVLAAAGGAFLGQRQGWFRSASVVPYSPEDRRMTFAVLTFQPPPGDAHGAEVAKATQQAMQSQFELQPEYIHVATPDDVARAEAHNTGTRNLAKALDVHFLIRGTAERAADGGYKFNLSTVDGSTERVLRTESLTVPKDALTPRWRDDLFDAYLPLVRGGLEAEVKSARNKPLDQLDVRDLSFRALADWLARRGADGKGAYMSATELLTRATDRSPEDPLAIELTAIINLCDCINAWSKNPEEQKSIGAQAMEKYLRIDPNSTAMLLEKASLYQLRGRYEESLVMMDALLRREPESRDAMEIKAYGLLRLGRAPEALPLADALQERYPNKWADVTGLDADVHYAVADFVRAAPLAQAAATQLNEERLRNPIDGAIRLTQIAAEARLGHLPRAKAAFEDLKSSVPSANSITAIKKWMHPSANLAGYEPLFAGLRMAGIPD